MGNNRTESEYFPPSLLLRLPSWSQKFFPALSTILLARGGRGDINTKNPRHGVVYSTQHDTTLQILLPALSTQYSFPLPFPLNPKILKKGTERTIRLRDTLPYGYTSTKGDYFPLSSLKYAFMESAFFPRIDHSAVSQEKRRGYYYQESETP